MKMPNPLPVFLADIYLVYIHAVHEPPLALLQLDVIATHLPLSHPPIFSECPILQTITSLPLQTVLVILILVPKLDSNLNTRECE
jgi:hypothetical protein